MSANILDQPLLESELTSTTTACVDLQRWAVAKLEDCTSNHPSCQEHVNERGSFLPTRLLDVRPLLGKQVRLVLSERLKAKYMALSYCWGGDQPIKLTRSNIQQLQSGLPLEHLPKTVQDAVRITRWFKIDYLWVDALCIIQGDAIDWAREAQTMDLVYRHSTLTIAAQGAKSSKDGCFARRSPLMLQSCKMFEDSRGNEIHFNSVFDARTARWAHFPRSPLCKRAWAVQERFLSPRILYFGDILTWECCEIERTEIQQNVGYEKGSLKGRRIPPHHANELDGEAFDRAILDFTHLWRLIVAYYTSSQISHVEDWGTAIQGCIKFLGWWTGFDNLAGLWRPVLPDELLWSATFNKTASERQAPTWSWLGLNASIETRLSQDGHLLVEILHAEVSCSISDGRLRWDGSIILTGFLSPIQKSHDIEGKEVVKVDHCIEITMRPDSGSLEDSEVFFLPIRRGSLDDEYQFFLFFGIIVSKSTTEAGAYERRGFLSAVGEGPLSPNPGSERGQRTITLV